MVPLPSCFTVIVVVARKHPEHSTTDRSTSTNRCMSPPWCQRSEPRRRELHVRSRPRLVEPCLRAVGISLLALRRERLDEAEQCPPILRISPEVVPIDGLRFDGPARV